MALVSAYFCLYYNLILSYTLHYMFSSFSNPLPWVGCNNTWNTELCYERTSGAGVLEMTPQNSSNFSVPATVASYAIGANDSELVTDVLLGTVAPNKTVRASEEYWM